jgi:hypothetical protein
MSKSEDDYPEIGKRRRGMVLVCHGDDLPDRFADWLQSLVTDFERLSSIASEFGVDMDPLDGSPSIIDVMDFCQRLGIEFRSNMWEGSLISGIYHLGWIKVGTVRSAAAHGKMLLRALEKQTDCAVRSSVMRELQDIKELDEFIDRTADDRHVLLQEIASLGSSLQATKSALDAANNKISTAAESNTAEIDRSCMQLAAALLTGEKCRVVAGPLVLWEDGVVYAICSWGGSPIPEGSSPAVLMDGIQRSGRRVVLVRDTTVIGGRMSGPIYRKGPANISGWSKVWSFREKRDRVFSVVPPEFAEQVRQIHEALASVGG